MRVITHAKVVDFVKVHSTADSALDNWFRRLIDVSDQLIDTGAGDENHPLAGLLYLVGMLIEEYEKAHDPTW